MISLLTQVYGQPRLLKAFTDELCAWPEDLAAECELVVIDDCGDPAVAREELDDLPMQVQLHRHTKDIPWAQPCCRNLAARHARGDTLILLDPDMMIPPKKAARFVREAQQLQQGHVLRFCLKEMNHPKKDMRGKVNLSSPNCWIICKADFEAVHGYNEEFAGHKGWSDVELLHVLDSAYDMRQDSSLTVDFYRRSGALPDACVTTLDREVKINLKKHARNREIVRKKFSGNWHKWRMNQGPVSRNLPSVRVI